MSETTTAKREGKPLSQRDEKILTSVVPKLFKDGSDEQTAAVRYGRKLLKKKAGLRSSQPPMTGLTKAQAAEVCTALGIEAKQSAKKAPTKKASAKA